MRCLYNDPLLLSVVFFNPYWNTDVNLCDTCTGSLHPGLRLNTFSPLKTVNGYVIKRKLPRTADSDFLPPYINYGISKIM